MREISASEAISDRKAQGMSLDEMIDLISGLLRKEYDQGIDPVLTREQTEELLKMLNGYKQLKDQPEIVRCKDCRKGSLIMEVNTLPYIRCYGVDHEPDWFCADGERNDIK